MDLKISWSFNCTLRLAVELGFSNFSNFGGSAQGVWGFAGNRINFAREKEQKNRQSPEIFMALRHGSIPTVLKRGSEGVVRSMVSSKRQEKTNKSGRG